MHELDVLANAFASKAFGKKYDLRAEEFNNKRYKALYEAFLSMEDYSGPDSKAWIIEAGRRTGLSIDDVLDGDTFAGPHHLSEMRRENIQKRIKDLALVADSLTAEEIEKELNSLKSAPKHAFTATTVDLKQYVADDYEKYLKSRKTKEFGYFGSWEGFNSIVGPERGHLITLGARPSIGKSAFAMNLAYDYAQLGHKILYVSLEMSMFQLTNRIASQITRISNTRYKYGEVDPANLVILKREIAGMVGNIQIMEGGQTMDAILAKARQIPHDMLVIDHIDLLTNDRGKNETEASAIGRQTAALKAHATSQKVLVLCLSQFNREAKNDFPQMHQLRGSGSKEQDSDIVLILHRSLDSDAEDFGLPTLRIAKNREGQIGDLHYKFVPETTTFTEIPLPKKL